MQVDVDPEIHENSLLFVISLNSRNGSFTIDKSTILTFLINNNPYQDLNNRDTV